MTPLGVRRRRVAVTGLGAVSALGFGADALWQGLRSGRCGIRGVTVFPVDSQRAKIAAEVPDFNPEDFFSRRALQRFSRCDQLGLVALREAVAHARLGDFMKSGGLDLRRAGVILGAGAGGSRNGEIFYRAMKSADARTARPSLLLSYAPSCTTDAVAGTLGFLGQRSTVVTACSSSNTAIGYAADLIRSGEIDVAITGGSDALCELTFTGFNALKAVSLEPCRPFDRERDGLSLGEAAGMLILEDYEHAVARGAPICAEFLGYGLMGDAYHMTAPSPSGEGALGAMQAALADAGIGAHEIDYISAHGTATPQNDLAEARAIATLFSIPGKPCPVPVSAPKSMLGHCLGACGAIEAVALILTLLHDWVPPTIHHRTTDPECPIDCVPNAARPHVVRAGMSNSFAFGGNNTSIVLAKAAAV